MIICDIIVTDDFRQNSNELYITMLKKLQKSAKGRTLFCLSHCYFWRPMIDSNAYVLWRATSPIKRGLTPAALITQWSRWFVAQGLASCHAFEGIKAANGPDGSRMWVGVFLFLHLVTPIQLCGWYIYTRIHNTHMYINGPHEITGRR